MTYALTLFYIVLIIFLLWMIACICSNNNKELFGRSGGGGRSGSGGRSGGGGRIAGRSGKIAGRSGNIGRKNNTSRIRPNYRHHRRDRQRIYNNLYWPYGIYEGPYAWYIDDDPEVKYCIKTDEGILCSEDPLDDFEEIIY